MENIRRFLEECISLVFSLSNVRAVAQETVKFCYTVAGYLLHAIIKPVTNKQGECYKS